MNLSTHTGQTILQLLELDPSAPGPWQQLMMLCFDQRDIETLETLRLMLDGLHKVHAARKNEAKKHFEEAVARMKASGIVSGQSLPKPIASTFILTENQRVFLTQLAREPNTTRTLERVGRIFAEDWKQPEIAQKFYERAMCYEAEDDDVLRSLAQAVETLSSHMPSGNRISGHLPVSRGFGGSLEDESLDFEEFTRRTGPLPGDTVRMGVTMGRDKTRIIPHNPQADTMTIAGMQGFLTRISKPLLEAAKLIESGEYVRNPNPAAAPQQSVSVPSVIPSAQAMQAQDLTEHGHLQEAETLLRDQQQDATVWPVWVNLGLSHFEEGRIDKAIEAFQTAAHHEPNAVEPHFNLGIAHFRAGQAEEAVAAYQRAATLDPTNSKVACNLGAVYFRMGRLEDAEEAFRRAIEHQPDYAKAWDNLASVLGSSQRLEEAEEACRKAIEINPYYAEPKFKLGTVLYHQGRRDEARAIFEEVLVLRPDWGDCHAYLAMIQARAKLYEEAMAHLEKASELNSDTELTALGWLILGESILYSDPTHAASCLTRATALNPNHARAWGVLSQAHLRAHELVEAEQAALHWTTLDPESSDAWQNLGAVYYTDDKFTEASHAFEQAAEFRQDSSPIWCDLAASLQMLGLLDAAVLALKRASEAEPTDPVPVARHGSIRFYQENFAEAAEVLAHAISLPSPPAEAYTLLGKSYQALNRPEEALAAFRQAVEFKPENPEAWEDLCLALTRAGLVEEAGAAMQKALDLQNQESAAFELDAPTTV